MPLILAERRVLRLAVLCGLYVAQGIPYGFVTVTLAAYLAGRGASTGEIGDLTALVLLPWSFKWVLGPYIDRFSRSTMGRRRPWIVAAQVMLLVTAGSLIVVPELSDDLALLGWIVFAQNCFAALQDVSVDALAVDLLPERERGIANGAMYGGSYVGIIFGGAALSIVLDQYGMRAALLAEVIALGAVMLLALAVRERAGDALFSLRSRSEQEAPKRSIARVMRDLRRAFARRSPLVSVALALTIQLGYAVFTVLLTVLLMQELGWSQTEFGEMVGGLPLVFGLAGSVGGGFVADRLGHRRTVAAASILVGVVWVGFAAAEPMWTSRWVVAALACATEGLFGVLSAALFALFMGVSWPRVAATQFTAYMALLNLGRTLGSKLSGPISEVLDTASTFFAIGALQMILVLLLVPIDPHQNRRELGDEQP